MAQKCKYMAYMKPMQVIDVFSHVLFDLSKCPNASSQVDVASKAIKAISTERNTKFCKSLQNHVISFQMDFKCHSTGTLSVGGKKPMFIP